VEMILARRMWWCFELDME